MGRASGRGDRRIEHGVTFSFEPGWPLFVFNAFNSFNIVFNILTLLNFSITE